MLATNWHALNSLMCAALYLFSVDFPGLVCSPSTFMIECVFSLH